MTDFSWLVSAGTLEIKSRMTYETQKGYSWYDPQTGYNNGKSWDLWPSWWHLQCQLFAWWEMHKTNCSHYCRVYCTSVMNYMRREPSMIGLHQSWEQHCYYKCVSCGFRSYTTLTFTHTILKLLPFLATLQLPFSQIWKKLGVYLWPKRWGNKGSTHE